MINKKRILEGSPKRFPSLVYTKSNGFTLVELLIVVSIIGVLAAITVPNFKKYQARSKIVEAKLQLASIYTAETSFYQLFEMYSNCLSYMGYDPSGNVSSRYFAVGFSNFSANINAGFYNSAVGQRLNTSECSRTLADLDGESIYVAGKSIGSSVLDNIADIRAATPNVSNQLDEGLGPFSDQVHSGLGEQDTEQTQAFTAVAVGYVDSSKVTPLTSALWTINHTKKLTNFRPGY